MYRCEVCGRVVPPGTPAVKRVVETRERQYPLRNDTGSGHRKPKARRRRSADDPGGQGREIVREELVCPACCDHPVEADAAMLSSAAQSM